MFDKAQKTSLRYMFHKIKKFYVLIQMYEIDSME